MISREKRIAVIAHVFYPDIWPEIFDAIANISNYGGKNVSVFITLNDSHPELLEIIKKDMPHSDISIVKNIGWDVWPFFSVLNRLELDKWDIVIKLHTKRDIAPIWINFRPFERPNGWRSALLSFCSDSRSVAKMFRALERNPKLGMVASERVTDPFGLGTGRKLGCCVHHLESMGLPVSSWAAVWGTMWAMRAELLRPMWRRWNEDDFVAPTEKNPHAGYGLAGECEILFGAIVCAQGCYISSASFPGWVGRFRYILKIAVFWVLRNMSDILKPRRKVKESVCAGRVAT